MTTKKIVYVHTGEWPSQSPSVVFVTGTVAGLASQTPTVLYIRNGSADDTPKVFRSVTGEDIPAGLTVERAGFGGTTPGHTSFYLGAGRYLKRLAVSGELEAVITRSIGFVPHLVRMRKKLGVPCYFEPHDFFGDRDFRSDLPRSFHNARNRWIERRLVPRLDGIIALTDALAGLFREAYPNLPMTVAPTGLMRVSPPQQRTREKLVCYIGSLDRHKGVGTVIAALGRTADRDIRLLVVGGKTERERSELQDFAKLVRAEGRVEITGWVHHADIGHYLDRCIAGVVPLVDSPYNRRVTSPLKILDCFSRSLPVIASDLPSVRQFVQDDVHGLLFPPNDPDGLAAALDRYVGANLFEEFSPMVESHARSFLWTERARTILAFIRGGAQ